MAAAALAAPALAQGSLFTNEYDAPTGPGPYGCQLAHFDGDGMLDLVVCVYYQNRVQLYRGLGDGRFVGVAPVDVGPINCAPRSVKVADFNGDGLPDLATANASSNSVGVLLGTGPFQFGAPTQLPAGQFPVWVQSADLDHDGDVDIAVGSQAGREVSVMLGDGAGGFGPRTSYPLGFRVEQMRLGDVNNDGHLDAVVCSWLDERLVRALGDGAGGFGPPTSYPASQPKGVALFDFDGDGWLDVATCDTDHDRVEVRRGSPGGFLASKSYGVGNYPTSIEAVDLNLDGRVDLVTCEASGSSLTVLVNVGQANFGFAATSPITGSPYNMASGDLDGDGRRDLVTTHVSMQSVKSHIAGPFGSWERYCTAKVNSLGCTPAIGGSGTPSATNARPFQVRTLSLISFKSAMYFYSVVSGPNVTPFQGGSLCMAAAGIRRTPIKNTGGYEIGQHDCGGMLLLDMNAFAAGLAGANPDPALQTAGGSYVIQGWARDPDSTPYPISLTDALSVQIGP